MMIISRLFARIAEHVGLMRHFEIYDKCNRRCYGIHRARNPEDAWRMLCDSAGELPSNPKIGRLSDCIIRRV